MMQGESPAPGKLTRFATILFTFCALDLLSWPIFLSYYLWVFADRSNFLHLDYMLAEHIRLGVDAYYAYGLLPVLLQHAVFAVFGRGYWPMVGCTVVVLILMAAFWSSFVGRVSNRWSYIFAVVAIAPFLLWVNPNFPYSLVQLSILFALLFVLEGRPEVALAVSVVGCFSVPSLPLLLTSLLAMYIALDWWIGSDRSIAVLARRLAPGALTYLLIAAGLSLYFGYRSVLVTALPIMGVKFYYGSKKADFSDLIRFVHPAGHSVKYYVVYYLGTPAGWWILSTIALVIFAALGVREMIRRRTLVPGHVVVVLCAILQVVFVAVAYRGDDQHVIYDPMTAAGVLAGISLLSVRRWRGVLLGLFICIGFLAQGEQVRHTLWAWKNTHPSPLTANLYAEPEYGPEMAKIMGIAKTQKVLMMSNATGVHHYYPSLRSADSWFLVVAQMFPSDRERVYANLRDADVVVEDTTHSPYFTDRDPVVQGELSSMCLTDVTQNFEIFWRNPPPSETCLVNRRQRGFGAPPAPSGR